jgi:hypothetical protein
MNHIETQFDEAYDYYSAHDHGDRYYTKATARSTFWYAGNCGTGSGADADLIYHASGNKHAADFAGLGIPSGLIIWWEDEEIPAGWHICDGNAGTRDLRDKFIIGAGAGCGYSVGDTGGSATFTAAGTVTISGHSLTVAEIPSHCHTFTDAYSGWAGDGSWSDYNYISSPTTLTTHSDNTGSAGSDTAHVHSAAEGTDFTGNAVGCLPHCYALFCIQKL